MVDEQRDDATKPSDELSRSQEPNANREPPPAPTQDDAAQEIEAEDRFEATDN